MDGWPALATRPPDNPTVLADQAIFTSIRSPTGEGYRLVAASPGVRAEERKEITQLAPSHDSLCDPAPDAVGFSCYRLGSGRCCVAYSQHAGAEHTGRGGLRVYTHITVIDEPAYAQFDGNPLRVHAAVAEATSTALPLKPPGQLDSVSLAASSCLDHEIFVPRFVKTPAAAGLIARLVSHLLAGRRLIVVGAPAPLDLFVWTLMSLPLSVRQRLSASVGLKFSQSRSFQFAMINPDQGQTQRAIRGLDLQWVDASGPAVHEDAKLAPWPELIHRWLSDGRFRDICRLTAQLGMLEHGPSLDEIASLCAQSESDGLPPQVAQLAGRDCTTAGAG